MADDVGAGEAIDERLAGEAARDDSAVEVAPEGVDRIEVERANDILALFA